MRHYLTRFGALTAAGVLLAALPMCARDTSPTDSPTTQSAAADEAAARAALQGTPLGQVISRGPGGTARVIFGGLAANRPTLGVTAETAARVHLLRHVEPLGLNEHAVRAATVSSTHDLAGGASIVQFEQRVDGIEVFRSRASVVLDATKNLVSIGSNLQLAGAASRATKWNFGLTAESALASLYGRHFGQPLAAGAVSDVGPIHGGELRGLRVAAAQDAPSVFNATSKRILYPQAHGLMPAYYIEFFSRAPRSKENQAWGYAVSAKDGRVLYKTSLTQNEAFKYRVWAEPDQGNIPMDGPYIDYTPNPAGVPNRTQLTFRTPNLISMDGFDKNKDPWLAADKTVTFGNNVHAYSDRSDTHAVDDAGSPTGEGDGYDAGVDLEGTVTSDKTFDRTYDTSKEPNASPDQIKAAVTQLFYNTNWLHDYWYDSGFDEKSGVAQVDNYGRGGIANDPLLAEGQDGADFGQGNNANMSTPSDGSSPTMQMYVWSPIPRNRTITTAPTASAFGDWLGTAVFGAQTFDLTGPVVIASPADACAQPTNVSGKIAVIDRGTCDFTAKAINAQKGGATGIILINNAAGHAAPSPGVPDTTGFVTIPLLALSLEDGQGLKNNLSASPPKITTATLHRGVESPAHDGTIDNSVVAHEWGHYLHHRLVNCGSKACGGMSEGWADFDALLMVVREAEWTQNKLVNSAFPLTQYGTAGLLQDAAYFGIRRAPYSTDMAKFPFTFRHVQGSSDLPEGVPLAPASADMSEVHNVGEIWAEMLFEGYVNLQVAGKAAGSPFQATKRRMANYIVAGMKATPTEPSFTEQRDAILATVWAMGQKEDFNALAQGFAKRGLGVGAISPVTPADPNEDTLEGAVESFESNKGDATIADAKVEEVAATSCDHDGYLDTGETGQLTIDVRNAGWVALKDTKVSVSTTDPSISFGNGGEGTVESLDLYGTAKVTIPITVLGSAPSAAVLPLHLMVSNSAAFTGTVTSTLQAAFNLDDQAGSSATDNVEAASSPWVPAHGEVDLKSWSRKGDATNHVWHGDDVGSSGDETLVSPDLTVSTDDLVISFNHRYVFEYSPPDSETAPPIYWDGGVLEISDDNGGTWKDVKTFVDPGYPNKLIKSDSNVLSERPAWSGVSSAYPDYEKVSVNLAKNFSGKTVKVRFRIGSDAGGGAGGWDIDDIAFSGITSTPFASQVAHQGLCGASAPGADAGSNGVPARYTVPDDACAVSAVGHTTRSVAGLGLFGGLLMLLRRRRAKR